MSLLKKLIGKDDEADFAALEKVRQAVEAWTAKWSGLNDRVSQMEAEAKLARTEYFKNPSAESFDKLVAAIRKAKESREVFTANVGVLDCKRTELVETEEVRDLLTRACRIVHKRLSDLAAQHDAEERTRCAMIGVEYAGSPTAAALTRKAERLADELVYLDNPDRPCWSAERVLASV